MILRFRPRKQFIQERLFVSISEYIETLQTATALKWHSNLSWTLYSDSQGTGLLIDALNTSYQCASMGI